MIGDRRQDEFRSFGSQVEKFTPVRSFDTVIAALSSAESLQRGEAIDQSSPHLEHTRWPALLVLLETRSSEHCTIAGRKLISIFPLAAFVTVLGSWAEHDPRQVGEPEFGEQIPWHRFPDWWLNWWHRSSGLNPIPLLPPTASAEERFLTSAWPGGTSPGSTLPSSAIVRQSSTCRTLGIHSPDASFFSVISDGATAFNWQVSAMPAIRGAAKIDVVLWDICFPDEMEFGGISKLRKEFPHVPIVVALSFPTPADRERLCSLGNVAVMSKPLDLSSLFELLDGPRISH